MGPIVILVLVILSVLALAILAGAYLGMIPVAILSVACIFVCFRCLRGGSHGQGSGMASAMSGMASAMVGLFFWGMALLFLVTLWITVFVVNSGSIGSLFTTINWSWFLR